MGITRISQTTGSHGREAVMKRKMERLGFKKWDETTKSRHCFSGASTDRF